MSCYSTFKITLLGMPVHLLVHANIYSANHVAAIQCRTVWHGQEVQLMYRSNIRMGKKCNWLWNDYCCQIQRFDDLGISRTTVSGVYTEWCEKQKTLHYAEEHLRMHKMLNLEVDRYSCRIPQQVPLTLQWARAHKTWTVEIRKKHHLILQISISAVTCRCLGQNLA